MLSKSENRIVRAVSILFALMWGAIIVLNLFFAGRIDYSLKKNFAFSNIVLLLMGVVIFGILGLALSFAEKKHKLIDIKILSTGLFFVQAYVFYNIEFHTTGWDPWTVYDNANMISKGETDNLLNLYFSGYPNNQLIVFVQSVLLRISHAFDVFDSDGFMFMILVQCVLCTLTGKLLFEIIEIVTGKVYFAYVGWLAFVVLLGLSGWNVVTYTDMFGLIFPTAVLRVYLSLKNGRKIWIKWASIFALSYWGYKMKPTALIMLIAILIAEVVHFLTNIKSGQIKKRGLNTLKVLGIGVASVAIYSLIFTACIKSTGLVIDKERDTGPLHMMLMGLNYDSDGVHNPYDVSFSFGIPTKAARTEAQLGLIKERLQSRGLSGFLHHVGRKALVIFNDGTFAWGVEGGFFDVICEDRNEAVSPFLKSLYYNSGSRYLWLSTIEQLVWITVLFLSGGLIFFRKNNKEEFVIILSLIGIILFNLLFEARARYVMLYVPIFILASVLSTSKIEDKISAKRAKGVNHEVAVENQQKSS